MDAIAFRELRAEIEADLQRFATALPALVELNRVKASLIRLQQIAHVLTSPAPPSPEIPPKPVLPTPPPIPDVPMSERYRQVSIEMRSDIKKIRRAIDAGDAPKAARKRLGRLEHERVLRLQQILREEAPPGFLEMREELKRQHKKHQRQQTVALAQWDAKRRDLQQAWEVTHAKWRRENPLSAVRQHAIDRLRLEWERFRSGKMLFAVPVGQVPWRFLPPPEPGDIGLEKTLSEIQRYCPHLSLDVARLRFAYGLKPSAVFIGLGEFDGYLAFTFKHTNKVLLECPLEGNAAYLFHEDWEKLSRLTKTALLLNHRSTVDRVIHDPKGWWRYQLQQYVGEPQ
jgi:hypothetical protein